MHTSTRATLLALFLSTACTPSPAISSEDGGSADQRTDASDGSADAGGEPAGDAGTDAGGVPAPMTTLLTPAGQRWFDPEVMELADGGLLTWQDERARVWVAQVDLASGGLRPGSERLMGDRAAPLLRTFNGPELGLDETGWAVYYTRVEADGGYQAARSRLVAGAPALDVVTAGDQFFSPLATKSSLAASTRLILLRRPPEWGTALWLDLQAPAVHHALFHLAQRADGDLRWVSDSSTLITNHHPSFPNDLSLVDTRSGAVTRISAGEGAFDTPYGWRAPEAGGEIQALALVNDTRLVVWRQEPGAWRQVASLPSPEADAGFLNLGSPEPFVARGRSYVSLTTSKTPNITPGQTEQHVWIVGLDPSAPLALRCDDREPGSRSRVDPEVLVGPDHVFVYYYILEPQASRVYVCAQPLPLP